MIVRSLFIILSSGFFLPSCEEGQATNRFSLLSILDNDSSYQLKVLKTNEDVYAFRVDDTSFTRSNFDTAKIEKNGTHLIYSDKGVRLYLNGDRVDLHKNHIHYVAQDRLESKSIDEQLLERIRRSDDSFRAPLQDTP